MIEKLIKISIKILIVLALFTTGVNAVAQTKSTTDSVSKRSTLHTDQPLNMRIGTTFPLQNYVEFGYIITDRPILEIYAQFGLPFKPYTKSLIENAMEDNDETKEYLKENLDGNPGYGLGLRWFYKNFRLSLGYNRLNYIIHKKSSHELVEVLMNGNDELKQRLNELSNELPIYSDIYNNYLVSPKAHNNQMSIQLGYQIFIKRDRSLALGIDAGTAYNFRSTVNISSEQSNRAAEIVMRAISPSVSKRLEYLINWQMIPNASLSLTYNFPIRKY